MLLPLSTVKRLEQEQHEFGQAFEAVLDEMRAVMRKRGEIRDVNTPVYYRRSPEECLGLAKNKTLRAGSSVTKLRSGLTFLAMTASPSEVRLQTLEISHLEDIIEETVDAANYLIFVAALCKIMLVEARAEEPMVEARAEEPKPHLPWPLAPWKRS